MDNQNWIEMVTIKFDFLFHEHDFLLSSSEYSEKNFGNRITILESDDLVVRIVLDRGQLTVRITPKFDVKFGIYLTTLVEYLTNTILPNDFSEPPQVQLSNRAKLFKDNAIDIFSFFDASIWNDKKEQIKRYKLQRLEEKK